MPSLGLRSLLVILALTLSVACAKQNTQSSTKAGDRVEDIYIHPTLGELYPEDVDWMTDEVSLPFCNHPISVILINGDDSGPSAESLEGYDWRSTHWPETLALIELIAFEQFYLPYADANDAVPRFDTPAAIWGTEQLICLCVSSKDLFQVSMRLDWQAPSDHHEITFYIEQGKCITLSVDG